MVCVFLVHVFLVLIVVPTLQHRPASMKTAFRFVAAEEETQIEIRSEEDIVAWNNNNNNSNTTTIAEQQHATLTVGAFNTEYNFRQSFCDRFDLLLRNDTAATTTLSSNDNDRKNNGTNNNNTATEPITIQNVLSGAHINVLLSADNNDFNQDAVTGIDPIIPGIHAEILDYIAEQSNFTWRTTYGLYSYQEVTANTTWTDLLYWAVNTYDIVIDAWSPNTERMNAGISFCSQYKDGSMILIRNTAPLTKIKIHWSNWILPFEANVWWVILITVLVSAMVYPIIEYIGGKIQIFTVRKWFTGRLYLSFINFTGNYSYQPETLGGTYHILLRIYTTGPVILVYT